MAMYGGLSTAKGQMSSDGFSGVRIPPAFRFGNTEWHCLIGVAGRSGRSSNLPVAECKARPDSAPERRLR